jgi:hypothetical protein
MSDDLIERLKEGTHGDHDRGCEGRQYSCTCGFDQRVWDAGTEAASRLAALQQRVEELERKLRDWRDGDREGVVAQYLNLYEQIKWRSVDKDNMEFTATITCWQMDAIRAFQEG